MALLIIFSIGLTSCQKETDEDLLIDDGIIQTSADDTSDEILSPAEDTLPVLQDSQIYNVWYGAEGFAANDESLFFTSCVNRTGAYLVYLMMSADRVTGEMKPMCTKPDCEHKDTSCGAYVPFGFNLAAISASENGLYYALPTANERPVFSRKLPDGAAVQVCQGKDKDIFPEETSNTILMSQTCFYDGDYYYPVCGGDSGDNVREITFYATVFRTSVTSGREEKTIYQEKVSGFDRYLLYLIPRREGLYIIQQMWKEEQRSDEAGTRLVTVGTALSVYLYDPESEISKNVFYGEYPEGFSIRNINILDGRLYFVSGCRLEEGNWEETVYSQGFQDQEPQRILSPMTGSERVFYDVSFAKDYIVVRKGSYTASDVMDIDLYGYEGEKIRSIHLKKPTEVLPESIEDYMVDGEEGMYLNMESRLLGCSANDLYYQDTYSAEDKRESFTYAVSADGIHILPFTVVEQ